MRIMIRSVVLTAALLVVGTSLDAQATARWYIGTYSNDLLVFDEASESVIDRIQMRHRIPAAITVSHGKDLLFVREATAQTVEVVDVAWAAPRGGGRGSPGARGS